MRIRLAAIVSLTLLAALGGVPVLADDVHLKNGRSFEGVIAEVTDSQVRIHMQGGVVSLPLSQVERVEKADSSFAEYLRRKEALRRAGPGAAGWLELAQWAKTRGLAQGSREAALLAAQLDPRLPGLEPLMRGIGYVLDQDLDRWIPYADSMRRKGFVESNGQWISREEYAAKQRRQEEELSRLRAARSELEAARAAHAAKLKLAELEARQEEEERRRAEAEAWNYGYGIPYYGYVGYWPPVTPGPPCCGRPDPPGGGHHPGRPGRPERPEQHPRPPERPGIDNGSSSFTRMPGSLIPGTMGPYKPMSSH